MPTFVTPGHLISTEEGFMRGHGTILQDGKLYATVAGTVEKINKLICVQPLKSRFLGEIGQVVIGRIVEVGQKRWKVDIGARQDSNLLLSSINLPGGIQRRKQAEDELAMRKFFGEGEIVCAEVQMIHQDGSISLHTRNYKYGKLCTGTLISVSPALIRRSRTYFHQIGTEEDDSAIELIIGVNGAIWIGKARPLALLQSADESMNTEDMHQIYANHVEPLSDEMRIKIAAFCNCVQVLQEEFVYISKESICLAYSIAEQLALLPHEILSNANKIVTLITEQHQAEMKE
jgi:exosome complex component RRP4